VKQPRILVIRGGAIGDFIMTLGALGALREHWPKAHIEILGYPHVIELAHGRYFADATRSIDARPMAGFFIPNAVLDPALMEYFGSFNLVISYLFDPDSIFANNVRRCGVKQLIEASPRPTELHAAEHYCKPLEALAIYVESPVSKIYPSESDQAASSQFLQRVGGKPIVAVHPGSGSEKKNWPVEKFAALCWWLTDELAMQLLVVEGEADARAVASLVSELKRGRPSQMGEAPGRASETPSHVAVARGLKLVELAAVLERCALFLGNDSGVTHIATAVGTPTVAMFGPFSPAIWEPRGDRVRVVRFGAEDVSDARNAVKELISM
jgi:heptosyltransferase-3